MIYTWIGIIVLSLITWQKMHSDVHKFQLNGYYQQQYLKWTFSEVKRYFRPFETILLLGMASYLLSTSLILKLLGLLFFLLHIYFYDLIRKAYPPNKKLVYTPRIKRLLFTCGLLVVSYYFTATLLPAFFQFILALVIYLATPLWVVLCNIINRPVETAVNNRYMNEAKALLAENEDLIVIGITGSYGKTSTKNVIHSMLTKDFNVLMTPESFNTPMGLTRTIRDSLKPIHQVFVAEMGAKAVGEIKELCDFVKPSLGIITSIGPQHLDTFKTFENIVSTKGELFKYLKPGGTAFINISDPNIVSLPRREDLNYITFTVEEELPNGIVPDYQIEDVAISSNGSSFTLVHNPTKKKIRLNTKLLGRHNLANVVAGAAVALTLGVPMERLCPMTTDLKAVDHRLSYRRINNTYTLLDDAFNSNPIGSKMALEVLKKFEGNKKIVITPGMIELGDRAYELNKAFGVSIAKVSDYVILVGKNQTKPIQDGLAESAFSTSKISVVATMSEAFKVLNDIAKLDDVVLIENDLPDTLNE